jgi:hypothetical protein
MAERRVKKNTGDQGGVGKEVKREEKKRNEVIERTKERMAGEDRKWWNIV